jgi:hypothetical protein
MKIFEVIEAKKLKADELDDVIDRPEDPDADKIPHILMQLRKAIDVDGNYPIQFKDGKKAILSLDDIATFVKKYMVLSPSDKESLQNQASNSLDGFMAALKQEFKKPDLPKIKGSRYMSSFGDEYPDSEERPPSFSNYASADRDDKPAYNPKAIDKLTVAKGPEYSGPGAGGGGAKSKSGWDKKDIPTRNKPEPKPTKGKKK